MASTLRIALISAIAIVTAYWGLVFVMRTFGVVDLPDPINLLPYAWRPYR